MIRATLSVSVLAAALLGAPALTLAAPPHTAAGDTRSSPRLSKDDRDFFDAAAQGGMLELKLAQHVLKQGASEDVKRFAQRMIDDHGKLNTRLADAARQMGLSVPPDLDKKHQEKLDKMAQLSGIKLDQEYMSAMVSDHKDDVKAFEKESKDGKDPTLRAFAASNLPALNEHLNMARQIQDLSLIHI